MTGWGDLSDSELVRRLTQRGRADWWARDLVRHRDDPEYPEYAARITEILQEPEQ